MGENKTILKELKKFKKRLEKDFKVEKLILFGSRARGKKGKEVDIDLIIVSPDFKSLGPLKRSSKMYDYWEIDYGVDFICYTPDEFNERKNRPTIVQHAMEEGIEI
ncbi:MAG: nucleotidyltransferase domain-containing protein [archaeon]